MTAFNKLKAFNKATAFNKLKAFNKVTAFNKLKAFKILMIIRGHNVAVIEFVIIFKKW